MTPAVIQTWIPRKSQPYGFAALESRAQVYINQSSHRSVIVTSGELRFSLVNEVEPIVKVGGEILIDEVRKNGTGCYANRWCSRAEWQATEQALAKLKQQSIRFVERTGREKVSRLQSAPTYRTLWIGWDVSAAPLKMIWPVKDEEFRACYFEQWIDGKWQRIEDPR